MLGLWVHLQVLKTTTGVRHMVARIVGARIDDVKKIRDEGGSRMKGDKTEDICRFLKGMGQGHCVYSDKGIGELLGTWTVLSQQKYACVSGQSKLTCIPS